MQGSSCTTWERLVAASLSGCLNIWTLGDPAAGDPTATTLRGFTARPGGCERLRSGAGDPRCHRGGAGATGAAGGIQTVLGGLTFLPAFTIMGREGEH